MLGRVQEFQSLGWPPALFFQFERKKECSGPGRESPDFFLSFLFVLKTKKERETSGYPAPALSLKAYFPFAGLIAGLLSAKPSERWIQSHDWLTAGLSLGLHPANQKKEALRLGLAAGALPHLLLPIKDSLTRPRGQRSLSFFLLFNLLSAPEASAGDEKIKKERYRPTSRLGLVAKAEKGWARNLNLFSHPIF